jgi:hypothetical protein
MQVNKKWLKIKTIRTEIKLMMINVKRMKKKKGNFS